jgi:hypothetical protein
MMPRPAGGTDAAAGGVEGDRLPMMLNKRTAPLKRVDGQIFRVPRPERASVSPDGGAFLLVRLENNAGTFVDTSRITELEPDE